MSPCVSLIDLLENHDDPDGRLGRSTVEESSMKNNVVLSGSLLLSIISISTGNETRGVSHEQRSYLSPDKNFVAFHCNFYETELKWWCNTAATPTARNFIVRNKKAV